MDYHAVPPPDYQVEATPCVNTCVGKILKESTKRRQEHQAPDNWKRLEDQVTGDRPPQKISQVKKS